MTELQITVRMWPVGSVDTELADLRGSGRELIFEASFHVTKEHPDRLVTESGSPESARFRSCLVIGLTEISQAALDASPDNSPLNYQGPFIGVEIIVMPGVPPREVKAMKRFLKFSLRSYHDKPSASISTRFVGVPSSKGGA